MQSSNVVMAVLRFLPGRSSHVVQISTGARDPFA